MNKCPNCYVDFEHVVEQVTLTLPFDEVRFKNDMKNPVCPDCLQEGFIKCLESLPIFE